MRFSIDHTDLREQFKDGTQIAPDELFAAMLAFSPEHVLAVSTRTAEDAHEWLLLGVTAGGLAVVEGAAKRNEADMSHPIISGVTATWAPVEALSRLHLQDVRESSEYYDRTKEVAVDATWVVEIDGQDPLTLPRDPENREGAVTSMVRTLLAKRQMTNES